MARKSALDKFIETELKNAPKTEGITVKEIAEKWFKLIRRR